MPRASRSSSAGNHLNGASPPNSPVLNHSNPSSSGTGGKGSKSAGKQGASKNKNIPSEEVPAAENGHAENGDENEEEQYDGAAEPPGGPADDPKERRKLRHEYRNLMEETQKQRQELINPENEHDQLHEMLQRQNEMFTRVKHTREAALDSTQLATVAHLAKEKAQNLHTDFKVFQPYEFAEKLISHLSDHRLQDQREKRSRISNDGWHQLGEAVQHFFKRSPGLHYMYGAFERGPPKHKERKKAERDKNEAKAETVHPDTVRKDGMSKEEVTTAEVEKVLELLYQYYERWNRSPICFFEFVINPENFGQTIENIFYVSFLVRDGFARVFLDDDELPVIEPVPKDQTQEQPDENKHQVIMSMTFKQWQELIKVFDIKRPLIPTRTPTSPPPEKLQAPFSPAASQTEPLEAEEPPRNRSTKKKRVGSKGKGVGKNR